LAAAIALRAIGTATVREICGRFAIKDATAGRARRRSECPRDDHRRLFATR